MKTSPQSEKSHIDYLYAWVHPGYTVGIDGNVATRGERALLRSIERLAKTISQIRDTAMLVLHSTWKEQYEECLAGKNGPGHQRWASSVNMVQEMMADRIVTRYLVMHPSNIEGVPGIKKEFADKGYLLDRKTQIAGIGETRGVCVPNATLDLTRKLRSEDPGIVDCSNTNNNFSPTRDSWKAGGVMLRVKQKEYKKLIFLPVEDDL